MMNCTRVLFFLDVFFRVLPVTSSRLRLPAPGLAAARSDPSTQRRGRRRGNELAQGG